MMYDLVYACSILFPEGPSGASADFAATKAVSEASAYRKRTQGLSLNDEQ